MHCKVFPHILNFFKSLPDALFGPLNSGVVAFGLIPLTTLPTGVGILTHLVFRVSAALCCWPCPADGGPSAGTRSRSGTTGRRLGRPAGSVGFGAGASGCRGPDRGPSSAARGRSWGAYVLGRVGGREPEWGRRPRRGSLESTHTRRDSWRSPPADIRRRPCPCRRRRCCPCGGTRDGRAALRT